MMNEQEQRRFRLHGLVNKDFLGDIDWVANAIEQRTDKAVSVRTIQAWLIEPSRRSSRNCPEWALKALEEYLQDTSNEETILYRKKRYEDTISRIKSPLEWSNEVRSKFAVEFATSQLENDSRTRGKWQKEFGTGQGSLIYELERRLQREITAHMKALSAIYKALDSSETFEDFREALKEQERADRLVDYFVKEAKHVIEHSSEEFADNSTT